MLFLLLKLGKIHCSKTAKLIPMYIQVGAIIELVVFSYGCLATFWSWMIYDFVYVLSFIYSAFSEVYLIFLSTLVLLTSIILFSFMINRVPVILILIWLVKGDAWKILSCSWRTRKVFFFVNWYGDLIIQQFHTICIM